MSNSTIAVSPSATPTKANIVRPWELSPKKKQSTPVSQISTQQVLDFKLQLASPYATSHCLPSTPLSPDSGYLSDLGSTPEISPNKSDQPTSSRRHLSQRAVDMMEQWYHINFHHPYPSEHVVKYIAQQGGITVAQVKKWMANKRVRSYNTLSFNGSIHPKRLQRIQRKAISRHHPYNQYSTPVKAMPSFAVLAHAGMGIPQRHSFNVLGHPTVSPSMHVIQVPVYSPHVVRSTASPNN